VIIEGLPVAGRQNHDGVLIGPHSGQPIEDPGELMIGERDLAIVEVLGTIDFEAFGNARMLHVSGMRVEVVDP
jgi:hypothetical protein